MRNLEAKFRLADPQRAQARAESLGFRFKGLLRQHDVFFVVPHGKLKLREQSDGAWLIHYRRDHAGGLELSDYDIVAVENAAAMRMMLRNALGTLGEVRKERTLLLRRNVRLHLDRIDGLGDFGEIEAVVEPGASAESYRPEVQLILAGLAVEPTDLIERSYFELTAQR